MKIFFKNLRTESLIILLKLHVVLVKIQAQIQSKLKIRKKTQLKPLVLRLSKSIFWVKNQYSVKNQIFHQIFCQK